MKTNIYIKKVDSHTYDCFQDEGWENWSRFINNDGQIEVIKGNRLQRHTVQYIRHQYLKVGA